MGLMNDLGRGPVGVDTVIFIYLLRNVILRDDFGTGPLPDLPTNEPAQPAQVGALVS